MTQITEFHNQKNGGSFMNRLFKASAMLAIIAASAIIMSCSDGKNGSNGKSGESCRATETADGQGFVVNCGGRDVYTGHHGPLGDKGNDGPDGEDCYLVPVGINFEVWCEEGHVGTLYSGEQSEGTGCDLLTQADTLLSIQCANNHFSIALCGGQTYNFEKSFCSYFNAAGAVVGGTANTVGSKTGKGELVPRCNGDIYDVRAEYCARNLVIGVDRMITLSNTGVPTLIENPQDVDPAKPFSDNWKVFRKISGVINTIMEAGVVTEVTVSDPGYFAAADADTCFYQKAGELEVKGCTEFGTSSASSYWAYKDYTKPSAIIPDAFDAIKNGCSGNWSGTVAQSMNYFDLTLKKCVGSSVPTTTAGGCAIVLVGENTCYSDAATPVATADAFVKACTVNEKPLYYDPVTVVECDEKWKNPELALKCSGTKMFSGTLYGYNSDIGTGQSASSINGSSIARRIYCVDRVIPTECRDGSELISEGSKSGTCEMIEDYKLPWCPTGWVWGGSSQGKSLLGIKPDPDTEYQYGGVYGDDPRDYCVKAVDAATMCPPGTTVEQGRCIISAAGKSVALVTGANKNGVAYSYSFYASFSSASTTNSFNEWLDAGLVYQPASTTYSATLCFEKGGTFDRGLCHFLPISASSTSTVYLADKTNSASSMAKCPGTSKLMLASLDSVIYAPGSGSIMSNPSTDSRSRAIKLLPLWGADATYKPTLSAGDDYIEDNEIPDVLKTNQQMIINGLSYYCIVENSSGASEMRCPQGTYASDRGWCEKVLWEANTPAGIANGGVAVKDSIRPSCPVGFAPMFTNANYQTSHGTAYNRATNDDNGTKRMLPGIIDFPHLGGAGEYLAAVSPTEAKQVCAQILTNAHCDDKETILYKVTEGEDNYMPLTKGAVGANGTITVLTGSKWSADARVAVPGMYNAVVAWTKSSPKDQVDPFEKLKAAPITDDDRKQGAIGKICLPWKEKNATTVTYEVYRPYSCPSITVNNHVYAATTGDYTSAAATPVTTYGCFISYADAGDDLCAAKDSKYEFDPTPHECKLKDELPQCQLDKKIDGIDYKFGVDSEESDGLRAKQSFQTCAVLIENSFCKMNRAIVSEYMASSGVSLINAMSYVRTNDLNVNRFNFDDEIKQANNGEKKRCEFRDGDGFAGCKPGFTMMKPGVGNSWCEGVL
jgi:hypothetical protein